MPASGADAACAAVIVLAILLVAGPGLTRGGLGWSDAPNHAFDGIFVLELARELLRAPSLIFDPSSLREWAERFYLRFPALGILVYYPPGFAAAEACLFAVFGVGIATARLTVLLFCAAAALLMYSLGRRWFDRPTGLLAALLLVTCPHGVLWARDVMLEWPATFWILATVRAFQRDGETPRPIWSIAFAACGVMAFMTKQTAGFILPVLLLHAWIGTLDQTDARAPRCDPDPNRNRKGATDFSPHADRSLTVTAPFARSYWSRPVFLASIALAAGVVAAYLLLARPYTALPSELLRPSFSLADMAHWPAEIVGWPLLPLVTLGLLTFLVRPDRGVRGLLLLWFAAWTGFSLSIAAKEPRYFFFSLPPLMFAAVRFLLPASRVLSWRTDRSRLVLLAAVVVAQTALTFVHSSGRLPRYDGPVRELAARPDADLVLVDAVRDGQFVFDLYQDAAARGRIIPLRASKLLYARAAREKYHYRQLVSSPADIVALLDRYGIRYVVTESAYPRTAYRDADPPPRRMLRELLAGDPRFRLLRSWPLRCGDPAWDDVELRLYAYPSCPPRTSKTITLSFPAMGRDVQLDLPPR